MSVLFNHLRLNSWSPLNPALTSLCSVYIFFIPNQSFWPFAYPPPTNQPKKIASGCNFLLLYYGYRHTCSHISRDFLQMANQSFHNDPHGGMRQLLVIFTGGKASCEPAYTFSFFIFPDSQHIFFSSFLPPSLVVTYTQTPCTAT